MDLATFISNLPVLFTGIKLTLEILVGAMACGLLFASLLTTVSFVSKFAKRFVDAYIFVIRGTPMLVQFYFIYYGLPQLNILHTPWIWQFIASPISCAIIALTLNTGAYTTVILRGAFMGVPSGEINAAKALGMTRGQIFRKITLIRALSLILPVYSNEVLMLLKGTALASTITVLEITGTTQLLISETYQTIPYWLIAGAIYLCISGIIIGAFKLLERRFAI
jgi:His/Glu/Gln/Arg/opine family amino acid ABC transporter permease subunit